MVQNDALQFTNVPSSTGNCPPVGLTCGGTRPLYSDAFWIRTSDTTFGTGNDIGTFAGISKSGLHVGNTDSFHYMDANRNNIGTGIETTAENGTGFTLTDAADVGGTSDYIYAWNGLIYFDSDSEKSGPRLTIPSVDTSRFTILRETGRWQDLSSAFGYYKGTFLVASDVPEPSSWMMMLAGFGGLGAMMRRRRRIATILA
jgi:hypothetical protein